jgi:hypothetical protein
MVIDVRVAGRTIVGQILGLITRVSYYYRSKEIKKVRTGEATIGTRFLLSFLFLSLLYAISYD